MTMATEGVKIYFGGQYVMTLPLGTTPEIAKSTVSQAIEAVANCNYDTAKYEATGEIHFVKAGKTNG
jgi:hypothetical protein